VTQSSSYYADLGFVWGAATREEYFDLLYRGISRQLKVSPHQQDLAMRCYFLAQCCNLLKTDFTPGSLDLLLKSNPDLLFSENDVRVIVHSLDADEPLSFSRFDEYKRKHEGRPAAWQH
jgi:hypothetical protein